MTAAIDALDERIVKLLQENGRMANTEIAKRAGVSEATVRNRLNRLIGGGIVEIAAVANPFKLGHEIIGTFHVQIDHRHEAEFIARVKRLDDLWYIVHTAGAWDFYIEFTVTTTAALDELIAAISAFPGVTRIDTSLVRKFVRQGYNWWPGRPFGD